MISSASVMLVGVDEILRHVVKCFLRECWGATATVVGAVDGGADAAARVWELKPDVVMIDLGLGDPPGLEVLSQLRRMLPTAGIIALGRRKTAGYRDAAAQAGADEFVVKADVSEELFPAIHRVVRTRLPQGAAA